MMRHMNFMQLAHHNYTSPERQNFFGVGTRLSHAVRQICKAECQQICLWRPTPAAAYHTAATKAAKLISLATERQPEHGDRAGFPVTVETNARATYRHLHDGRRWHTFVSGAAGNGAKRNKRNSWALR